MQMTSTATTITVDAWPGGNLFSQISAECKNANWQFYFDGNLQPIITYNPLDCRRHHPTPHFVKVKSENLGIFQRQ